MLLQYELFYKYVQPAWDTYFYIISVTNANLSSKISPLSCQITSTLRVVGMGFVFFKSLCDSQFKETLLGICYIIPVSHLRKHSDTALPIRVVNLFHCPVNSSFTGLERGFHINNNSEGKVEESMEKEM